MQNNTRFGTCVKLLERKSNCVSAFEISTQSLLFQWGPPWTGRNETSVEVNYIDLRWM